MFPCLTQSILLNFSPFILNSYPSVLGNTELERRATWTLSDFVDDAEARNMALSGADWQENATTTDAKLEAAASAADDRSLLASVFSYQVVPDATDQEKVLPTTNHAKTGAPPPAPKLGTFMGVFLPCLQNILGVILFLRLPFITAQAGVFQATAVVFICVTSTFLTSLSLSAIATNGKVLVGGPYFLISRNLGRSIGGAIGFLFYIGTTLAASMYVLGAVEAFQTGFKISRFSGDTQIQAEILIAVLAGIVAVGIKYVNMSALVFLAIVILSFFSFSIGGILFANDSFEGQLPASARVAHDNMKSNFQPDPETGITPTFFSLLALFYPSVTGIMAGSNRSGVLRSPGTSIPIGTISAVLLTSCMYLGVIYLFGMSLSNETLMKDKMVVAKLAYPAEIIVNLGIIMSCVGAGLQSLTGAPQLLAAMAADETIPFIMPFKAQKDEHGNSKFTRAIALTWAIGALPCLAGNLDFITAPLTMCFLMMYATTNLSTFMVSYLKAPSFRPSWKYFNKWVSLLGFFWCMGIMFMISWYIAFIVIALAAGLMFYIQTRGAQRDYGDTITGMELSIVRRLLLWLKNDSQMHTKNWRPQILAMIKTDQSGTLARPQVLRLADQLKKGKGLLMVHSVLEGNVLTQHGDCAVAVKAIQNQMKQEALTGFTKCTMAENRSQGIVSAIQSEGVGQFRPNTVLFGWDKNWRANTGDVQTYVNTMKTAVATSKALMILKGGEQLPTSDLVLPAGSEIHIWWVCPDGGFVLIIPYLLCLHKSWVNTKLHLMVVMNESETLTKAEVEERIRYHLEQIRIEAIVTAVDLHDNEIVHEFETIFSDKHLDESESEDEEQHDSMYDWVGDGRSHKEKISSKNVSMDNLPDANSNNEADTTTTAAPSATNNTSAEPEKLLIDTEGLDAFPPAPPPDQHSSSFDAAPNTDASGGSALTPASEASASGSRVRANSTRRRSSFSREEHLQSAMKLVKERSQEVGCAPIRIRAAMALNSKMKEMSGAAVLIVTNLPLTLKTVPLNFMGYIDSLTEGLPAILMLKPGSGQTTMTAVG